MLIALANGAIDTYDVREAFRYDQRVKSIERINAGEASRYQPMYCQTILTDGTLIAQDENNSQLWKIPFYVSDDGTVSFGTGTAVRKTYSPTKPIPPLPEIKYPSPSISLSNLIALNGR